MQIINIENIKKSILPVLIRYAIVVLTFVLKVTFDLAKLVGKGIKALASHQPSKQNLEVKAISTTSTC